MIWSNIQISFIHTLQACETFLAMFQQFCLQIRKSRKRGTPDNLQVQGPLQWTVVHHVATSDNVTRKSTMKAGKQANHAKLYPAMSDHMFSSYTAWVCHRG